MSYENVFFEVDTIQAIYAFLASGGILSKGEETVGGGGCGGGEEKERPKRPPTFTASYEQSLRFELNKIGIRADSVSSSHSAEIRRLFQEGISSGKVEEIVKVLAQTFPLFTCSTIHLTIVQLLRESCIREEDRAIFNRLNDRLHESILLPFALRFEEFRKKEAVQATLDPEEWADVCDRWTKHKTEYMNTVVSLLFLDKFGPWLDCTLRPLLFAWQEEEEEEDEEEEERESQKRWKSIIFKTWYLAAKTMKNGNESMHANSVKVSSVLVADVHRHLGKIRPWIAQEKDHDFHFTQALEMCASICQNRSEKKEDVDRLMSLLSK